MATFEEINRNIDDIKAKFADLQKKYAQPINVGVNVDTEGLEGAGKVADEAKQRAVEAGQQMSNAFKKADEQAGTLSKTIGKITSNIGSLAAGLAAGEISKFFGGSLIGGVISQMGKFNEMLAENRKMVYDIGLGFGHSMDNMRKTAGEAFGQMIKMANQYQIDLGEMRTYAGELGQWFTEEQIATDGLEIAGKRVNLLELAIVSAKGAAITGAEATKFYAEQVTGLGKSVTQAAEDYGIVIGMVKEYNVQNKESQISNKAVIPLISNLSQQFRFAGFNIKDATGLLLNLQKQTGATQKSIELTRDIMGGFLQMGMGGKAFFAMMGGGPFAQRGPIGGAIGMEAAVRGIPGGPGMSEALKSVSTAMERVTGKELVGGIGDAIKTGNEMSFYMQRQILGQQFGLTPQKTEELMKLLKSSGEAGFDQVKGQEEMDKLFKTSTDYAQETVGELQKINRWLGTSFKVILGSVLDSIMKALGLGGLEKALGNFKSGFIGSVDKAGKFVGGWAESIANKTKEPMENFWRALKEGKVFKDKIGGAFDAIKPLLKEAFHGIFGFLKDAFNVVKPLLKDAFNAVKPLLEDVFNEMKSVLKSVWGVIEEPLKKAFSKVVDWLQPYIEIIGIKLGGVVEEAIAKIPGVELFKTGTPETRGKRRELQIQEVKAIQKVEETAKAYDIDKGTFEEFKKAAEQLDNIQDRLSEMGASIKQVSIPKVNDAWSVAKAGLVNVSSGDMLVSENTMAAVVNAQQGTADNAPTRAKELISRFGGTTGGVDFSETIKQAITNAFSTYKVDIVLTNSDMEKIGKAAVLRFGTLNKTTKAVETRT